MISEPDRAWASVPAVFLLSELCISHYETLTPWLFFIFKPHVALPSQGITVAAANVAS